MNDQLHLDRIPLDFTDGTLFGNDAGEDELPDVLNSYFVEKPGFAQFLSRKNKFQVARSRKGMGKSALLSKLAYDLESDPGSPLIVKVTGADLIGLAPIPRDAIHLQLQNYWQRVICARINYALGAQHGFAFSDNSMALVESAEIAGFKERNLVGSLISRIKSSKIPIEMTLSEAANHEALLKRVQASDADRAVWFFVDDIDSTYIDTPEQQALISTFFSACRSLVRDVKGLYIRVSVRSDVWTNIRKNEDLDKSEQYVTDLAWSREDLHVILSKKIYSWYQRAGIGQSFIDKLDYRADRDAILEYAFPPRVRWGSTSVAPFRPINILSAGRPRWMSQLCRLAGMQASKRNRDRIGIAEINDVMKTYSGLRVSDIYKEHSHQYNDLQKLIETFSNSPARYSTMDLLSQLATRYINAVGSASIPPLNGFPYQYPLQLAHFLFKIGFIVGRRDQANDSGNAEFVRFEERPELLTDARNPDDGLLWEVHPAYRDALTIGKEARAAKGAEAVRQRRRRSSDKTSR